MYSLRSGLLEKNSGEDVLVFIEKKDSFIRLSDVSLIIWKELKKPVKIDQIVIAIKKEFEVSAEQAKKDVQAFLKDLTDLDLIEYKK